MPIVIQELAQEINEFKSKPKIQWIPVEVIGAECAFAVLNTLEIYSCLNTIYSNPVFWTKEDGIPQKTGQIRHVEKLVLDPNLIPKKAFLFRIEGLEARLICSEEFKWFFTSNRYVGISFKEIELAEIN